MKMLQIIEKAKMPNGTEIQIEYSGSLGWNIGAYPIAKATGKYNWVRRGETFRLTLTRFDDEEHCRRMFDALKNGEIELEHLAGFYWNGSKDAYYMGIVDKED